MGDWVQGEWMDRYIAEGQMVEYMDEWMGRWMLEWVGGQMEVCVDAWVDEQMDIQTNGAWGQMSPIA